MTINRNKQWNINEAKAISYKICNIKLYQVNTVNSVNSKYINFKFAMQILMQILFKFKFQ